MRPSGAQVEAQRRAAAHRRTVSRARSCAVPRVPSSPREGPRCRRACPADRGVPPTQISASSGCAATARMSSFMRPLPSRLPSGQVLAGVHERAPARGIVLERELLRQPCQSAPRRAAGRTRSCPRRAGGQVRDAPLVAPALAGAVAVHAARLLGQRRAASSSCAAVSYERRGVELLQRRAQQAARRRRAPHRAGARRRRVRRTRRRREAPRAAASRRRCRAGAAPGAPPSTSVAGGGTKGVCGAPRARSTEAARGSQTRPSRRRRRRRAAQVLHQRAQRARPPTRSAGRRRSRPRARSLREPSSLSYWKPSPPARSAGAPTALGVGLVMEEQRRLRGRDRRRETAAARRWLRGSSAACGSCSSRPPARAGGVPDPTRLDDQQAERSKQIDQRAREGARQRLARAREERIHGAREVRLAAQLLLEERAQRRQARALVLEHDLGERHAPRGEPGQRDLLQVEVAIDEVRVVHLGHVVVVGVVPEERHDGGLPGLRERTRQAHGAERGKRVERAGAETRLLALTTAQAPGRASSAPRRSRPRAAQRGQLAFGDAGGSARLRKARRGRTGCPRCAARSFQLAGRGPGAARAAAALSVGRQVFETQGHRVSAPACAVPSPSQRAPRVASFQCRPACRGCLCANRMPREELTSAPRPPGRKPPAISLAPAPCAP